MKPSAITSNLENAANKIWHAKRKMEWSGKNPIRFEKYPIQTKTGLNYLTFSYPDDGGPLEALISVEHPVGFEYGTERILFNIFDNYMFGKEIYVGENYQDCGMRIGEILKLSSIMLLIKNNYNKIKLYSTNPSVLFQAKYKFEPEITRFSERKASLRSILNSREPNMRALKLKASELLTEVNKIDVNSKDTSAHTGLFQEINNTVNEFMQQMFKNSHRITDARQPFTSGFGMVLTKEKVLQNKDFFNNLYQKHDIDFQI